MILFTNLFDNLMHHDFKVTISADYFKGAGLDTNSYKNHFDNNIKVFDLDIYIGATTTTTTEGETTITQFAEVTDKNPFLKDYIEPGTYKKDSVTYNPIDFLTLTDNQKEGAQEIGASSPSLISLSFSSDTVNTSSL